MLKTVLAICCVLSAATAFAAGTTSSSKLVCTGVEDGTNANVTFTLQFMGAMPTTGNKSVLTSDLADTLTYTLARDAASGHPHSIYFKEDSSKSYRVLQSVTIENKADVYVDYQGYWTEAVLSDDWNGRVDFKIRVYADPTIKSELVVDKSTVNAEPHMEDIQGLSCKLSPAN
jgi:hypothetical protein